MRPMSSRPRQRAEPSVAQRSTSRCVDRRGAVAQPADHQRMADRLHHVGGIVRGRAVDAERRPARPPPRARRSGKCPTPSTMSDAAQWQTPTPARPSRPISSRVEMDAVRDPGALRHPSRLLEQVDRPHAECRRQKRSSSWVSQRWVCKLAIVALGERAPSRSSAACGTANGEQGASAIRICAPGADRGTASARARCRRGSSPRPARCVGRQAAVLLPKCPSSRASPSCACRARAPPRPRCRSRSPAPAGTDSDDRPPSCSPRASVRSSASRTAMRSCAGFSRAQIGSSATSQGTVPA